MAENMYREVRCVIHPDQYCGCCFDGAYAHCHVGEEMDDRMGVQGVHDTDPMHLAGRVDARMRDPKGKHTQEFGWLNKFTLAISKTNNLINFGQGWHMFFKVKTSMFFKVKTGVGLMLFFRLMKLWCWLVMTSSCWFPT